MSVVFRPMLAADISEQLDKLRFPVYVTPKLDGVRALIMQGAEGSPVVMSRSMKVIPNKRVQATLALPNLVGIDGELIVGDPTAKDVYRKTQSVVATADDPTPATFYAFDVFDRGDISYQARLERLYLSVSFALLPEEHIRVVPAYPCASLQEVQEQEEWFLTQGYEGCIVRSYDGRYKNGRSTVKEQGMLKLKRFVDGEALIVGIEEEMHNGNEAKTNELGRTERSSHKENLSGKGRMGALVVEDVQTKVRFKIGTGFTAKDRVDFWKEMGDLEERPGVIVKYRHFPLGAKDKPRHPTYAGRREAWDR